MIHYEAYTLKEYTLKEALLNPIEEVEALSIIIDEIHFSTEIFRFKNLKILRIQAPIRQLPIELFKTLNALEHLYLHSCPFLREIPNEIIWLVHLKQLSICQVKLEKEIPVLPQTIEVLSLIEVNQKEITASILKLKKLRKLELNNNLLYSYNNDNNSYNEIKYVPKSIKNLCNLEEINLSFNPIGNPKNLIDYLSDIPNLNYLALNNIGLRHIPTSIKNLKKLKFVYLSENTLKTLPFELSQLQKLKVVDISNNELTKEHIYSLFNLKRLMYLIIYNNSITPNEYKQLQLNFLENYDGRGTIQITN